MNRMLRLPTVVPVVLLACGLSAAIAVANDFSLNDGAFGPEPIDIRTGQESLIRMAEEELTFRFGKWQTHVHARFVFENTSADSTVRQLSGFPDMSIPPRVLRVPMSYYEGSLGDPDLMHRYTYPLWDMKTFLDGEPVDSRIQLGIVKQTLELPWGWVEADADSGLCVWWHVAELIIPPGGRVILERSFWTMNGYEGLYVTHYNYCTLTGGPWQGTIGKLTADVILEDGLTPDHLVWCGVESGPWDYAFYPPRHEWKWLAEDRLRLVWTDFEPMLDDRRHRITLAWKARHEWETREHRWDRFTSPWWPWNWFRR